jgi:hypothetical protein
MKPQQGIMSLAKPKQRVSARDSRAIDQILDNTTQMLGKLDKKTLGLLLQLTQYIKANKPKYKELMANLEAKGSLPSGVFPREYDPKFLSVFALSVAKAQQAKNGMAAGGIAGIAQTMQDQGRGEDTMLAHISPSEAKLLEKRGGVGTINPATGLPEYGIFDDIGNALSGVGHAVGSVLKPVGDLIGGVMNSPLAMAAAAAAAYYFMGPSAGAVLPSVAEATLPGEVAGIGTAAHLTPAAIESGIGSAGYGYNASAASSGLFNPATIGAGAAIGAPSTNQLLTANLLKNANLLSGEEQSDPNALIKMLMMYDMMGKQNQPADVGVPALTETTSSLPYDAPKKQTYQQSPQRAAEGGLMTKYLGIGGLSANRTQTDYAKNYLPGSGYRPGQGGVTYFTPMRYGNKPAEQVTNPVDDLVKETIKNTGGGGSTGGGGHGSSEEGRADREEQMDKLLKDLGEEGYAKRNDWIGNLLNGNTLVQLAKLAKQGIDMVEQTWANERLKALGIDPNIVLANQNKLAGLSMQQALNSLGQAGAAAGNYAEVGGYTPGSQEAKAAAAGTVGGYGPGTPGFNAIPTGPTKGAFLPSASTDESTEGNADREAAADNARIDALIASLPDAQQVTSEEMGAVINEKGEIDPHQGNRTALNPFPTPLGSIVKEFEARNVGTYTPGQFQGAFLPSASTDESTEGIPNDVIRQLISDSNLNASASQDAETRSNVAPENYTFRTDRFTTPIFNGQQAMLKELGETPNAVVEKYLASNTTPIAPVGYTFQTDAVKKMLDSLGFPSESNATVERYLAANQNISPTQYEGIVSAADLGSQFPGLTKTTTQEQADRIKRMAENFGYSPMVDPYSKQAIDPQKYIDNLNKKIDEKEQLAETAAANNFELAVNQFTNEANQLRTERENFLAGSVGDQYKALANEQSAANLMGGDVETFAPVETTPKSEEKQDKELDQIIQSFISDNPSNLLGAGTLLAGTDYTGGIPSTTIGNYGLGTEPSGPNTSGLNLGSLDANGMLKTFPGATDQVDLPSLLNPTPDLGMVSTQNIVYGPDGAAYNTPASAIAAGVINYSMSPPADLSAGTYYDNSLAGDKGFEATGGFGNVWRSADGTPIRTGDGSALQTGQGSKQQSLNDKVNQIVKDAQIAAGEYTGFSGPVFGPAPAPAPAPQPMMTVMEHYQGDEGDPGAGWTRVNLGRGEFTYTRPVQVPVQATGDSEHGDAVGGDTGWGAISGDRYGGDYGSVDPGYRGGSEAATGGLSTPYGFQHMAHGGIADLHQYNLGAYSDGGRLLKGPGDGVSDDIPATIGRGQPARLADGEFVIPARIVSELGNGSTDAGAKRLYEMMDRIQRVRRKTKNVAANTKAAKYLPA